MESLKKAIVEKGNVTDANIVKVDSFLNHQMDIELINEIGKNFYKLFKDSGITKILTIEASGIGIACITAQYFNVPVVFAKKIQSINLDGDMFTSKVHSYTHDKEYTIRVSKKFLSENDNILIIDDFLARGKAMLGLLDILHQSKAKICGAGIVIEKGYQEGGELLRSQGLRVESLAIIDEITDGKIIFR